MSDAFRIAQSGRPGPVWIDIPKDIQTAVFDIEEMPEPAQKMAAPAFSEDSIRDAAAMINAAKRPVLYLGGGVINAPERVRELAEKAKLPTTMTLMALGMLPKAHPLSLGMLGMHGARSTNFILQEADLLIVPGARFDDRAIGKTEQFCPNAKIIHVDIDRAELGKIKQPHVAIRADVDEVLAQLIPQIEAQPREEWHQLVSDLQQEFPCAIPQKKSAQPLWIDQRRGCLRRRQRHYHHRRRPASDVGGTGLPAESSTPVADLRRSGNHGLWPACGDWCGPANPDKSAVLLRRWQPDDEYSGNGDRQRKSAGY